MRGAIGVVMIVVALGVLYMAFQPKNTKTPNVKAPNINDAARGARDAGNGAADQVASWTPETWRIIAVLLVAGLCVYVFYKYKALRWIAVGVFIGWVVIMVATQ